MHEGHEPDALGDLRNADVPAGEDLAGIHCAAFEADPATPDDGDRVVKRIGELLKQRSLKLSGVFAVSAVLHSILSRSLRTQ